jgi:hypothetical protein
MPEEARPGWAVPLLRASFPVPQRDENDVVLVFDPELELPFLSFGQLCFWPEGAFAVAVAFGVGVFVWAEAWDRPVTPA